ncbi:polysaccharide deacetylase family protein [Amycolatopsis jejuensis]|uniref:polysaccharide deacetylase family protein n=1 Tax=Amycolatopsis jejuensis TaxID=330084 RepID=UPI00052504B8|nr:polysaccharide deacetylase family protein [Amycolatopsis jejuensis]
MMPPLPRTGPLPHHHRFDYVPIVGRPDYSWPEGRRLAIYVTLLVESFPFGAGIGHLISRAHPGPDVRSYGWREYGNRVGVWRLLDLLDELGIPVSAMVNSTSVELAPQVISAVLDRGGELIGHGRTNAERQAEMAESDEAQMIASVRDTIAGFPGATAPRGWLGPWLSESPSTPDLLREAGFDYVCDWSVDDQPIRMRTRSGPILAMPYSTDFNDAVQIMTHHHTAREFARMTVDRIDEMARQSVHQPLVCTIQLHPLIFGQPHRLPALREALRHVVEHPDRESFWLTTPGQIHQHCAGLPEGTIP